MDRIWTKPGQVAPGPCSWPAFLLRHCLAGVAVGWTTVGGLLWLDVAGLGRLVLASDLFPLPLFMLLVAFGLTFGSVAVGSAVMDLGRRGHAAAADTSAPRQLAPGAPPAAPRRIDWAP